MNVSHFKINLNHWSPVENCIWWNQILSLWKRIRSVSGVFLYTATLPTPHNVSYITFGTPPMCKRVLPFFVLNRPWPSHVLNTYCNIHVVSFVSYLFKTNSMLSFNRSKYIQNRQNKQTKEIRPWKNWNTFAILCLLPRILFYYIIIPFNLLFWNFGSGFHKAVHTFGIFIQWYVLLSATFCSHGTSLLLSYLSYGYSGSVQLSS